MDQGLFAKYIRNVNEHTDTKQRIIATILEKTGITVGESEFALKKKTITLSLSSVKKAALMQKGVKDILSSIGYTLHV